MLPQDTHRTTPALAAERPLGEPRTELVGTSPAMGRLHRRIEAMARAEAPVLITGESGSGKELVARALHERSARAARPMVAVNCAAFPDGLIEAELFGHERGAFTGASARRAGRFKAAHGGTLFLDEVAELPLPSQAKLLRVLQTGAFEPLGTNDTVTVDVRVVSATHRDLKERIRLGLFREDLYYRVKVLCVEVPPLRQRIEDLRLLVEHFLRRFSDRRPAPRPTAAAWRVLESWPWPGNVRELENAVRHAVALARDGVVDVEHLPPDLATEAAAPEPVGPLMEAVRAYERTRIVLALRQVRGCRTDAAHALQISRKCLWEKMRLHRIRDEEYG
jgi:DNA-binding NtrC family response regulator